MLDIDVARDFTLDTPHFWESFWEDNPLGQIDADPDRSSPSLRKYQMRLYRRKLPNGEFFDLRSSGLSDGRMVWNGIEFSSDAIINNFRHKRYPVIAAKAEEEGYREWTEDFLHRSYTIGGETIWPVKDSINVARAFRNTDVSDRMDLTLYCVQAYYDGLKTLPSPGMNDLLQCMMKNSWFFDLFADFKGYVDFFFLNDLVDGDYGTVLWMDDIGRPRTAEEYDLFYDKMMDFLAKGNLRIAEFAEKN